MSMRFNPPPNWPTPPAGWTPPPGWRPSPSWGPPPPGWQLWIEDSTTFARPPLPVARQVAREPLRSKGPAMIVVAAASCGLGGFVPPLWAARLRPHDAPFRRRMYAVAGGLFGLTVVGMGVISVADVDATGSPTGFLGDLGGTLLLVNWILAVTVAVLVRNTDAGAELPAVAVVLARRRLRDQYRQLAMSDPSLARSMGIGRPDLPRHLDDGGLVDLNAIPAEQLGPLAGLSAEEAKRVADARQQFGPFTSIDEVALYAELPDTTVTMLRELAIFVPR